MTVRPFGDAERQARSSADRAEDEKVELAVRRELERTLGERAARIYPEVMNGIVALMGTADSSRDATEMEDAVQSIRGVRAVMNWLRIVPERVSDAALERRVSEALRIDPATERMNIDVHVANGVVTLKGSVSTRAERGLAEETASDIPGVLQVDDQLTASMPVPRRDPEIQADARAALSKDTGLDAQRVEVAVTQGNVTLTGQVASQFEKRRAIRDAWAEGARSVDAASLEVNPELAPTVRRDHEPTDDEIARAILDVLKYDPRVPAEDIRVKVSGRTATLDGEVWSAAIRSAACDDALRVAGIQRVDNDLRVRPRTWVDDNQLRARVLDRLRSHPNVIADGIQVFVDQGTVTLRGVAESRYESLRAQHTAAAVPGVAEVINELEVPPSTSDSAVASTPATP
jgi:osmotically-inducible protein OsmY